MKSSRSKDQAFRCGQLQFKTSNLPLLAAKFDPPDQRFRQRHPPIRHELGFQRFFTGPQNLAIVDRQSQQTTELPLGRIQGADRIFEADAVREVVLAGLSFIDRRTAPHPTSIRFFAVRQTSSTDVHREFRVIGAVSKIEFPVEILDIAGPGWSR